jgi:antitoxin MazE
MKATIKKWGNSPALRLSSSLMQSAHLSLDQEVTIKVIKGKLVIQPANLSEYTLEGLVKSITPENCHIEVSFGSPVGKEML